MIGKFNPDCLFHAQITDNIAELGGVLDSNLAIKKASAIKKLPTCCCQLLFIFRTQGYSLVTLHLNLHYPICKFYPIHCTNLCARGETAKTQ